ncbi:MAG: SDR family NAD(P)-dependent oxidoreductase [Polyangiaceae bacterium]|nr:SDR family NAD(P)-dependent oxidoreductase [Polyangiaceae bacterium]
MVLAGDRDAQWRWLDALQTPPELESDRGEIAPPPSELHPKVLHRLRQLLSKVSHLAFERIDAEEPLESYGIDSVLIAQLNAELEGVVPGLSKTLFFEYQTLNAVAGHIVEAHPQASAAWTGLDGGGQRAEPAAASPAPTSRGAAPIATPLAAPSASTATPTPRQADPGEPIAVIGISGRYPGAPTLAALWHNLQAGKDCIGEIPAERWPLDGFFVADRRAALAQGKSYSKWGGFLEGFANFDPLFFNISPREARDTDPQERLFLETCWATVEDAGYTRAELQARYQGRVGVFVGITKTGFDLYGPELWRRGELQNPQTSFSSVANRVSYALNWQGPSMAIDTMCSASLTAIHEACEHIRRGECDLAIAGGVNLYLHPSSYVRLCAQQMLSADGHCKSFGEGGDGFVPGEGVGAILLKPLSLALRDGDQIHALILGTSVNHGGKTNGYTVPNPAAQARLVRQAMARAGVSARQVSYLEAHGTGTKLGDPIEVRGLQQAFEADTVDKQFCAIGSIKSNIGHLEAAAGIAGVTKVLLQMRHRTLVPSLHAETLNANIDFDQTPFFVQRELGEWPRPATLPGGDPPQPSRLAGVSSFGAGGSNGHVLLADYESAPPDDGAEGPHAIVLSAKDGDRLKAMAGNLARHLRDHRDTLGGRLRDVAYTLQIGRDAMDERLAFVATSYADAEKTLQRFADGEAQIEGVRLGRVKANGDFLAIFDDEDAADVVERWLAKRKYGRLLELWVKGLEVDWKKLYRDVRPRRLSLPTYPFAGATYWLATDQVRPAAEPSLRSLHPLAQVNTSTFEGQAFRALLSGQEFFLSEHRVHGKGVLPGVAYLEMARAAVALSGPARVAGLRNVLWSSMLTVERPTTVTIDLSKDGDRVTFVVKTAANAEPHAQGSVVLEATPPGADVPAAPAVDVAEIEARCPVTIRDEQIYAHFQRLGLDYGPGFRALRDIKRGQGELLASYRLPASVASSEFALHPSVMDAALQASIGFAMHTDPAAPPPAPADPLLPFSVHAVDLLGEVSPAGYVHVVRVGASSASDVLAYDIRILNDNFVPCVALRRLTLRPLVRDDRRPAPRPRPPSPPDPLLFATPRWREQAPPPEGGERPDALVLLVGGDAETAGRLATRLGSPVEVLAVDDELPIEEAAVEVMKQAFAKIKAALYRAPGAVGARAVRAVYVLASSERDARFRGPLAALLATVQQENGNARGRLIALSDRQLASADVLYDVVQREGAGDPAYHEIVYRPDGARLVKQWDEADLAAPAARGANAAPGASPAWVRDRGVYWITGGLGGLGRLFSEHLASVASGPISLVLSGRTALTDEGRRYLQSLERPGVAIEYRPCDVGDDHQVRAAAEYIGRRYGRLDGVIHGAGVLRDGLMAGKDASHFEPVFAAKAKGAELIDRATESLNPEFFVLCSSVAAVTGNVGQAEYASANAYLDAFAEARDARRRASGRRGVTVSINWPLWRDGGMQVDAETEARLARRTGLSALPTVGGLAALDAILARGVSGQVLVLSGDVDRMRRALSLGTRPAGEPPRALRAALGVEQSLLAICAELLEIEQREFDLDTQLSEYGVDSIQMMRMLNRLEESYQITLDPSAIANHPTIRQLARYLVDEGAGGVGASPVSSRGGEARPTVGDASSPVTPPGEARASAPAARPSIVRPASQGRTGKIAIISQAGRFPRSPDLETFWLNLAAGKSLITEVPGDRWDVDSVYSADRSASDKSYSRHGGFLDDIAEFDAAFFGVNDDEALSLDPQHRIVLELARELFERAGYGREKLDGSRTAVLLGAKDNNYLRNHYGSFEPASLKNMIANSIANMMAARVSDFYNLKGAAKTVDTACSSSLVAVHDACQSIRTGEADMAVAGGIFLLVDPFYHVGFSRAEVLSDDGRMYVFDERAKGFVLGEGAGLVLLKDYDEAQRDGDRILGVVLASAVNNDGRTMGITVPSADGQKAVIEEALGRSGVSPEAIGYLEAHGTGTLLGDPIEVKAASDVYRKYTSATGYCALGSVKSNMGHSLTAAGIASLIKVLLGLQHGQIPATIHCTRPHPRFRFDASPFYPNTTLREWKPLGDRRVAAVTSLGFGGTNCHLIVADR